MRHLPRYTLVSSHPTDTNHKKIVFARQRRENKDIRFFIPQFTKQKMKKRIYLFLILLTFLPFNRLSAAQGNLKTIVIKNVSVVDVINGRISTGMKITINGERIAKIEKTGINDAAESSAFVVDASGKFLIPGLWDMHVHIDDQNDWMFPLFLANGVMGVRDMGSSIKQIPIWKQMQRTGATIPQIVAAGPIVTGPVTDEDPRLVRISTRAEGAKAVADLKKQGADLIKVYDYLSREAYLGIIKRARQLKIPVEGHLPYSVNAAEAARLGQKSIEHNGGAHGGMMLDVSTREAELKKELREKLAETPIDVPKTFVWATSIERQKVLNDTFDAGKARKLAEVLMKENTWICPTIISYSRTNMPIDERILTDERLKYVPKDIRAYAPATLDDFKKQSAETSAVRVATFNRHIELYKIFHQNKVKFLAGTDSYPSPVVFPGFSLHDELAEFVAAGFTPLEALQTATINPAVFLGRTNDYGTIGVGKRADVILLDANPLENIQNTKRISAVITGGRYLDRRQLDKMLDAVAEFHEKK